MLVGVDSSASNQGKTFAAASIPMGRWGDPKEIGGLAVYLASEASSFMTGSVLVLDGGKLLW